MELGRLDHRECRFVNTTRKAAVNGSSMPRSAFVRLSPVRWRAPCFNGGKAKGQKAMNQFMRVCGGSVAGLRGLLPMLCALLATRTQDQAIAASIPGIGPCRSTYCKAERRLGHGLR